MEKETLLIVGAGAAGLMAARELSGRFDITILEAQAIAGGRIESIKVDGHTIEAGAEFVHGDLPVTRKLLKEAGLAVSAIAENMYRKVGGELVDDTPTAGWEEMLEKMGGLKEDTNLRDFLDRHYAEASSAALRQQAISFASGFDLADAETASIHALYKEWSAEEERQFRVVNGYRGLIDYLRENCIAAAGVIRTNATVKTISWEKGKVTATLASGESLVADKILVTVPVSLLQKTESVAKISFTPALDDYAQAAAEIGFGAVLKVVFKFKAPFWEQLNGFIFSEEIFPTWWTQGLSAKEWITGWKGGPEAALLSSQDNESLLDLALASLGNIFDLPVAALRDLLEHAEVFNWQHNPYSRGGYSFSMVGTEAARKLLNEPVAQTIFFAGEALYEGPYSGTVEAALTSGLSAAKKITAASLR